MDIGKSLKMLGAVDSQPLVEAILEMPEPMWADTISAKEEASPMASNANTAQLVLSDCSHWPHIEVSKGPAWDQLEKAAVPVMHSILASHYGAGGTIIRAITTRLPAGEAFEASAEQDLSAQGAHRIHVPIANNSQSSFIIGNQPYEFCVGEAYEVNNQVRHSEINKGNEDQITFIFDYVPTGTITRTVHE
ncbi:MAG: hypothetical protein KUG75_09425 [Pseudomonadales bacterium]|nr:hypothetical protein [Pseudomonadales bacterium]